MNEFLMMMGVIVLATLVLMAGIRFKRKDEFSLDGSTTEAVSWGTGFFLTFTGQAAMILL